MRARAVSRFWQWVLTCLLLTFAAPTPAAAQVEDAIVMVADAEERAPAPCPAARAGISVPSNPEVGRPSAPSSPARVATPLYLLHCALLR